MTDFEFQGISTSEEMKLTWVSSKFSQCIELHEWDENGKIIATQKRVGPNWAEVQVGGDSWVFRRKSLLNSEIQLKRKGTNEILARLIKPLFGYNRLEMMGQPDTLYLYIGTDQMRWRTGHQRQIMSFRRTSSLLKPTKFDVIFYPSAEWAPYWNILACVGLYAILREIAPFFS